MRWTGPFATANVASMEMAMILVLGVLACAYIWTRMRIQERRSWYNVLICTVLAAATLLAGVLLIATGSRAGTLSALCGLTLLAAVRYLSWKAMGAISLLLILGTLCAPFQQRYTTMHTDTSVGIRFTLWGAALSVIADHPLHGLGTGKQGAQRIIEDWYMPPREKTYNVASVLNEPLTLAVRWGLPALTVYVLGIALIFSIGVQHARHGNVMAMAGLTILITHIISGQFQAHLLTGIPPIRWMWITGTLCALAGNPMHLRWRPPIYAMLAALALCAALYPLGHLCGTAQWKTVFIELPADADVGAHDKSMRCIALPRHAQETQETPTTQLVIAISPDDAPYAMAHRWREARYSEQCAVMMPHDIGNAAWWHAVGQIATTHAHGVTNISACASEKTGVLVWEAWRMGLTGIADVIISDPDGLPTVEKISVPVSTRGALHLRLSTLGFVSNSRELCAAAQADGAEHIEKMRCFSATWWMAP